MLKIRLQRVGRVHQPAFRLVLTESVNSTKSGRFKEVLGSYDPRKMTEALKTDRIKYWLSKGVRLTGTVNNLLIRKGILRGKKVNVSYHIPAAPAPVVEAAPVESAPEVSPAAPIAEVPVETPVETPEPAEVKSDTIESVPEGEPIQ